MRIVLDTNVLMSGIFWSGPPARILPAWSEGRFDLLVRLEILAEYRLVGKRLTRKYSSVDIGPVLDLVIRESRIVEPVRYQNSIGRKPLRFNTMRMHRPADFLVVAVKWSPGLTSTTEKPHEFGTIQ